MTRDVSEDVYSRVAPAPGFHIDAENESRRHGFSSPCRVATLLRTPMAPTGWCPHAPSRGENARISDRFLAFIWFPGSLKSTCAPDATLRGSSGRASHTKRAETPRAGDRSR